MTATKTRKTRALPAIFIFDFGGVMIKWKNNFPIYDAIADRYGIPRDGMRRVFELALPMLEAGQISTREFMEGALTVFGKALGSRDSAEEIWTTPFARLARLRAGSVGIVESLRKEGFKVYLFSNTSAPHAKYLKEVGWDRMFDGFVASCEVGACKPDPEAFRRVLDRIGATPSQVVFIDDKEVNVLGAKRFGILRSLRFSSLARLRKDIARLASIPRSPSR